MSLFPWTGILKFRRNAISTDFQSQLGIYAPNSDIKDVMLLLMAAGIKSLDWTVLLCQREQRTKTNRKGKKATAACHGETT